MAASAWVFQYSNSMPEGPSPAGSGWSRSLSCDQISQSDEQIDAHHVGVISVAPGTVWGSNDPSDTTPDHCRAYFQQAGDDLSGTGPYEFYRWFSHTAITVFRHL